MYPLKELLREVTLDCFEMATNDSYDDMLALSLDESGVLQRLKCLDSKSAKFIDNRWCETNLGSYIGWVPCDNYSVRIFEDLGDGREYRCVYYMKFGISPDHTLVLQISFHTSS
ncbi:hypothetical protein [Burkholderia vietnamiensis]|uniref:hypothetical protein n=1 Tax=Burkholderia vietnamiensis TaxID=60552 RepID=UPI00158C0E29|nr:hypothetical protein [Burkholderia vietnamiensis]MCA8145495.1 hypothetical protein [Burkholderia vietnamiensis]